MLSSVFKILFILSGFVFSNVVSAEESKWHFGFGYRTDLSASVDYKITSGQFYSAGEGAIDFDSGGFDLFVLNTNLPRWAFSFARHDRNGSILLDDGSGLVDYEWEFAETIINATYDLMHTENAMYVDATVGFTSFEGFFFNSAQRFNHKGTGYQMGLGVGKSFNDFSLRVFFDYFVRNDAHKLDTGAEIIDLDHSGTMLGLQILYWF